MLAIPGGVLWGTALGALAGMLFGNIVIGTMIGAGLGLGSRPHVVRGGYCRRVRETVVMAKTINWVGRILGMLCAAALAVAWAYRVVGAGGRPVPPASA